MSTSTIVPQTRRITIVTANSRSDFQITTITPRCHAVEALYNTGKATHRSFSKAVEFIREAAKRREIQAQAELAALAASRDGRMMAETGQPTPLKAWQVKFNEWMAARA